MFYVYVLQNESDKSLYIGYSADLKTRIRDHENGKGSRTTKQKKGWRLIYYEAYLDQRDAIGREKFLKSGSGRKYINKQMLNYFKFSFLLC